MGFLFWFNFFCYMKCRRSADMRKKPVTDEKQGICVWKFNYSYNLRLHKYSPKCYIYWGCLDSLWGDKFFDIWSPQTLIGKFIVVFFLGVSWKCQVSHDKCQHWWYYITMHFFAKMCLDNLWGTWQILGHLISLHYRRWWKKTESCSSEPEYHLLCRLTYSCRNDATLNIIPNIWLNFTKIAIYQRQRTALLIPLKLSRCRKLF